MAKEWTPSWAGRHVTGSSDWRLRLEGLELALALDGRTHRVNVEDEATYRVNTGTFWTDITFHPGQGREVRADGLPNVQGAALVQALNVALTEKRLREDVAFLKGQQRSIDVWLDHKADQERGCLEQRRWFTHEQQEDVLAARPKMDAAGLRSRLKKPGVAVRLGPAAQAIERSLAAWEADHRPAWAALNAAHVDRELVACKDLLDRVESRPLTPEQARAVVCFDNRVQVVASAGSGKTSTMVAKAAYAIHRGFVDPKRIVLLAFNTDAAEELKKRAVLAFERLGMGDVTVEASTFHALGLRLIGKATREKPDVPDWATDAAGGVRKLTDLVDQLKDQSPTFRRQWDLFRFVFGKDLPAFGAPEPSDVWDAQGKGALVTNRGERVKSVEEVMIANLLFLNGVDYRYEAPYPHRTADETHRQYKPDFYYPDLNLFHEHFALDANGVPPAHFEGYMDGVIWKRQLHAEKGTELFETTSHGLRHGDDFDRLERELTDRGLVLDPNPDREIPKEGQQPMASVELVGLVRTFMSHAKSNGLSASDLHQRLDAMPADTFKLRYQMFLDIAVPVMAAWDEALAAEDGIDFEDMLNLAASHLEGGRVESPYDLVMADEFQDASRARARLCRALVQGKGRFLFAVGDDWQSINRFAGADVSVMTGFRQWFGHGQVLKLEQTFRCPQALCDVSSAFVSKNLGQIAKRVHSATPAHGPVLQAFQVDTKDQLADAIDRFVVNLAEGVRDGTIPPGRNGKVSVYVLGRYNADRQYVPMRQSRFNRWVEVSFLTIHRSKGSEADYVILPEMISAPRRRSFPNTRTDDPVLALAMPEGDTFPLGEERRLFYVALTRARRTVAMFTARGQRSMFLRELVEDGILGITDTDGEAVKEEACPACKQGVLVLRTGPYGEFRSCSNFPVCSYKPRRRGVDPSPLATPPSLPKRASAVHPSQPVRSASVPQPTPPSRTLFSLLESFNNGLAEINRNVSRASAVQSATSDLKHRIFAERSTIESALELARSAISLEEKLKDPRFKEAYESLSEALDANRHEPEEAQSWVETPLPTFSRSQQHPDEDIDAAIQRSFDGLREDRDAFLSAIHGQLAGDSVLRHHFLTSIEKLHGRHYLVALDPTSSWHRI
ncbi:UvrD-helicase domain-containing protein [Stenotrophomonas maltophilia]|uniref:UvrD-helicase domain-containing protein n=1 Tax=Stenotrophomonas maltophilia TaxID=40324 RepID=UPI0004694697